jgi:predicted transcriptional regulator
MARPSRSKKHPAFDPAELDDLILSPAVGTGVGSHLISGSSSESVGEDTQHNKVDLSTVVNMPTVVRSKAAAQHEESPLWTAASISDEVQPSELSTVDTSNVSTADRPEVTTVDMYLEASRPQEVIKQKTNMSTVDITATVDSSIYDSDLSTVANVATVGRSENEAEPAGVADLPTVDMSLKPRAAVWITEDGVPIPAGRVKRIRLAQDVINPGEEAVYDSLWNARPLQPNGSDFRIVQVGYDYLVKRTRLSKKTIQRIIDKLLDKDFIAIERPADIYQRTATVYRVFGYKTVLERHMHKGRAHVAKVGPGFSYVHQLPSQPHQPDLSTVDRLYVGTVDKTTTETVVKKDLSTVVKMATLKIEHLELEQTSSELNQIAQTLRQVIGAADDDVARRLITDCRRVAPDAKIEEISGFVQQKARFAMRNPQIRNPIGFLLTAVPLCFEGESFRIFRQGREEAKRQEKSEMERVARMLLDDPQSSDDDRNWARGILGHVKMP